MNQDHPFFQLSEEQRDSQLRAVLGLADDAIIPPEVLQMAEDKANRPNNPSLMRLENEAYSTKLSSMGVGLEDNWIYQAERDANVQQFNRETIDNLPAVGGLGAAWMNTGTQLKRAAINAGRSMADMARLLDFGMEEYWGFSLLPGAEEAFSQKDVRNWIAPDTYYQDIIAQRDRLSLGARPWYSDTAHVINDITAGIVPFVAAGAISGVTAGIAMPGIVALTAGYANTLGREVTAQTGSIEQGIVAGMLNFAVTNSAFKAGHVFGRQMNFGLKTIFGKSIPKELGIAAKHLKWGEIPAFMNVVKGAAKIELSVVALRDLEYMANATFQEYFEPQALAEQYKFSWDNFLAVTKHGAEEGALFIVMPMLGKDGAFGLAGRSNRMFKSQMKNGTSSLSALTNKLNKAGVEERATTVEHLEKSAEGRESNPLLQYKLNRIKADAEGKPVDGEKQNTLLEEHNESSTKQQTRNWEEVSDWVSDVIPPEARSTKPTSSAVESGKEGSVGEQRARVETKEERTTNFEIAAEKTVADRNKFKEESELTPEEASVLRDKEKSLDPLEQAWEAANDVTGESLTKLRERVVKLESETGVVTTEKQRILENHQVALRTAEIMIGKTTGTRPTAGPKASPRETVVGDKTYNNTEAATKLKSKPRTEELREEKRALEIALRENNPEWAKKSNKEIAEILVSERLGSRAEIAKENYMTLAESKKSMELREKAVAEHEQSNTRKKALSGAKAAVVRGTKKHRALLKATVKEVKELRKHFNEYITEQMRALKEAGVDANVIKKLKATKKKVEKFNDKTFESTDKVVKAIEGVGKLINKELDALATKRVKRALGRRTEEIHTRVGVLDGLVTAIKKVFDPAWKEGGDWRVELDLYKERLKKEGWTETEAENQAGEIRHLIDKVEKQSFDKLELVEKTDLANHLENLYDQHASRWDIQQAKVEAEVEIGSEALNREIREQKGIENTETGFKRVDGAGTFTDGFVDFVKAVGWGMHANGRIADAVEYLTGGTNTTGYRLLVKKVHEGHADARFAEGRLQKGLREHLIKALGEDNYKSMLKEVSESNGRNYHKNKRFKPTITITMKNGEKVGVSAGELVGIICQSLDKSTMELWEANAGLRLRGREKSFTEETTGRNMGELISEIVEAEAVQNGGKGSTAYQVARGLVEFINTKEPTDMIREAGFRTKGIDIIRHRDVGDFFFPRVRRVKGDYGETKSNAASLLDISENSVGADLGGPKISAKHTKERTTTAKHDIVVGDGQFTVNSWFRGVTNLRYFEQHISLAQKVLSHEAMEGVSGVLRNKNRQASKILQNLGKNFYEPQLEVERGFVENFNAVDGWVRQVRNNLITAGLAYNPAIPAYQALSLIAASGHMGKGGKRAIAQAMWEMGTGGAEYRAKLLERSTSNSGLLYDRIMTGNAVSLSTGETTQAMKSRAVRGGERVKADAQGGVKGKWNRGTEAGMRPIEWVDNMAVMALFRATEIHLEAKWNARGKTMAGNEAVFNEWVRKEFEANLIETQPSFAPLHQPAIINQARKPGIVTFYTMFKGYTGKLVAMQRRSFMRANRAMRDGDMRGMAEHLAYGAKLTVYGSALIPLIRSFVKESISQGGAELADLFGITEEQDRELGDFALTIGEKAWSQMPGQLLGMNMVGDTFNEMVGFIGGDTSYGGVPGGTPYTQTITQLWRATESILSSKKDADFETQVKRWTALLRPALGAGLRMPQQFFNAPMSMWREVDAHREENIRSRTARGFGQ